MYIEEHSEALKHLLKHRTPALPQELLNKCVAKVHSMADVFLSAAEKFGSPLYFIDKQALLNSADLFRSAFSSKFDDFTPYFAMKSCNHPYIIRTLAEAGFGIDVSSGVELQTAIGCGAEKIVFSGPAKTLKELSLAAEYSDRVTILCDSFTELNKLSSLGRNVRIGVRLTTENNPLWRKFGIPLDELQRFIMTAAEIKHISFCGVQFHSSWNLTPDNHTALIKLIGETIAELPEKLRNMIEFMDIGGGYWPEDGEWLLADSAEEMKLNKQLLKNPCDPLDHRCVPSTGIDIYADAVWAAVETHIRPHLKCAIYAEPGRWVCHESIHLLLRVEDIKLPDISITDGGTNMIGWERFEMDYFPVVNVSDISMTEHPMMILGSLCTPHDIWGHTFHGGGVKIGDVLVIPNQGAYTYSLRQNFIKSVPESVVFDGKNINGVNCTSF